MSIARVHLLEDKLKARRVVREAAQAANDILLEGIKDLEEQRDDRPQMPFDVSPLDSIGEKIEQTSRGELLMMKRYTRENNRVIAQHDEAISMLVTMLDQTYKGL